MGKLKVTYIVLCFWITYCTCGAESQTIDKITEALHYVINPYRLVHAKTTHQFKRLPAKSISSQFDLNNTKPSMEFYNSECSVVYSPGEVDELEEDKTAEFTMTFQCPPGAFEVSAIIYTTRHFRTNLLYKSHLLKAQSFKNHLVTVGYKKFYKVKPKINSEMYFQKKYLVFTCQVCICI